MQLKVVRSKDRLTASGEPRSLGYGFVEFKNHEDAMAVLRAVNNNPDVFTRDRR
jgi:nucleolar protein 4